MNETSRTFPSPEPLVSTGPDVNVSDADGWANIFSLIYDFVYSFDSIKSGNCADVAVASHAGRDGRPHFVLIIIKQTVESSPSKGANGSRWNAFRPPNKSD